MKLPWRFGGRGGGGHQGGAVSSLQAHFDRVIPSLAEQVGLDLVATTLGWQAAGVTGEDLATVLDTHARLFREQYDDKLAPKRQIFPEQVTLYGPGKRGFWFCSLQFAAGLPADRQPLRPFLAALAESTRAAGFFQARVADQWHRDRLTPVPTVRLVTWDGVSRHGWQLPLDDELGAAGWQAYDGQPLYGGLAGYPILPAPREQPAPPLTEEGRLQLLQRLCDYLGTQLGPALAVGKVGRLPAAESFPEAVHEQTLAMQQWLDARQAAGELAELAELALLRPEGERAVGLARFSLRGIGMAREEECWAVLGELAAIWGMQGFVYALTAPLVVPAKRSQPLLVALLHQWDGLIMQEAWAPVQPEEIGPWQVRDSRQGATPALDGLCGYHMTDHQRRSLEELRQGRIQGVAVGANTLERVWCAEHRGRPIAYRCSRCEATGCSRCMVMVASAQIVCRKCAQ